MKCPYCGAIDDKVLESRPLAEGASIRRRRQCNKCSNKFTSYEFVEQKKLMVIKKDTRREEFCTEKLIDGVQKAVEKRPISQKVINEMIHNIEEESYFYAGNTNEIASIKIGEMVMKTLVKIDLIAYIRFASVYKEFDDVKQFIKEIHNINK